MTAGARPPGRRNVVVCEVSLRDGIQGWPTVLRTEEKIRILRAVQDAGVREIDATSFVRPGPIPQFTDAEAVLAAIDSGVRLRVLAPNLRGADRVVEAHRRVRPIDMCGIPFSASEPHNLANLHRDHASHKAEITYMAETLRQAGVEPFVCIATAFGCPIQGEVSTDTVVDLAGWAYSLGMRTVMFGDTTGVGDPVRVNDLFLRATREWPDVRFLAHFHDNRGLGLANTLAAIGAGAAAVDASLGGVGGEPPTVDQGEVGESGNVVTEDLVAALQKMDMDTGIDLDCLLAAGLVAERVLGWQLHSKVLRADASVQHRELAP